jgi:hypothetical protein
MKKLLFISCLLLVTLVFFCCSKQADSNSSSSGNIGTGGSLARFTIVGNYLYLADDMTLNVYKINDPYNPILTSKLLVGNSVETIYPYDGKLFIGSQFGMYIYSLANPESPVKLGEALHVRSCDPVVAKDTFAFVTLRSGTACGSATNALYSYSVKNVSSPVLLNILNLPKPTGLGYKDTTLFVCCEDSGLAVINIKNPKQPLLQRFIKTNTFYDVISIGDLLICMVKTGIDLYSISDVSNISLLKHIDN